MSLTHITERVIEGAFEEQFARDPTLDTGSNFGYTAGTVQGNGLSTTISGGFVTHSGIESYIYVDWNRIGPQVKVIPVTDTLPEHSLLLYHYISNSNIIDYRTWSMATTLRTGETSADLVSAPPADTLMFSSGSSFGTGTGTGNITTSTENGGNRKGMIYLLAFETDTTFVTDFQANGTTSPLFSFASSVSRIGTFTGQGLNCECWGVRNSDLASPVADASASSITGNFTFNQSDNWVFHSLSMNGLPDDVNNIVESSFYQGDTGLSTDPEEFDVVSAKKTYDFTAACLHSISSTSELNTSSQRSPWSTYGIQGLNNQIKAALTRISTAVADTAAVQTFNFTPDKDFLTQVVQTRWGQGA